jgi:hypothetical protein
MTVKLTKVQTDKIRKDFMVEIREIDMLKIKDTDKISIAWKFLTGYEKGFETCAGAKFDTKDIDIVFDIENDLAMFSEQAGFVEPGPEAEKAIEWIASSNWIEIIKTAKKFKL